MEKQIVDKQTAEAVEILKKGGVIAYPTDTIYGIGCDALNQRAIERVFKLKGRDYSKPLLIACLDLKMIKKHANLPTRFEKMMNKILPGPYTILLNKKETISDLVTAGLKKVGVRIPDNETCLKIIKEFGSPIITTSANISGGAEVHSYQELNIPVDFVVKGKCRYKQSSTIFDPESKKILRKGAQYNRLVNVLST